MALKKENSWLSVVECAVSGSIDYKRSIPSVAFCSAEMLEACVTEYIIQKKNCTSCESKEIYANCVEKALKQEQPGEKYLILAEIGSCVGFLAFVVIALTFVATHFHWMFLLFSALALSFIKTCNAYIREVRLKKKAGKIWKEAIQTGSVDNMNKALEQMEQVLLS